MSTERDPVRLSDAADTPEELRSAVSELRKGGSDATQRARIAAGLGPLLRGPGPPGGGAPGSSGSGSGIGARVAVAAVVLGVGVVALVLLMRDSDETAPAQHREERAAPVAPEPVVVAEP